MARVPPRSSQVVTGADGPGVLLPTACGLEGAAWRIVSTRASGGGHGNLP